MNAPEKVRTTDGMVWERHAETRAGSALYALAGVCSCPPHVMATLAELAEHGIEAQPVGALLPARDAVCAVCGHAGAEHQHSGTACWSEGERERRRDGTLGPVRLCSCAAFVAPHDGPERHTYRVSRDLPEMGGDGRG